MAKLIRYLIDLPYKQYLFEHIPLHVQKPFTQNGFFIFAFVKYSFSKYILFCVYLCRYSSIHACIGLPAFANKNTGCLAKFEFQINNKKFFV